LYRLYTYIRNIRSQNFCRFFITIKYRYNINFEVFSIFHFFTSFHNSSSSIDAGHPEFFVIDIDITVFKSLKPIHTRSSGYNIFLTTYKNDKRFCL